MASHYQLVNSTEQYPVTSKPEDILKFITKLHQGHATGFLLTG